MTIRSTRPPTAEWDINVSIAGDVVTPMSASADMEPYRLLGYEVPDWRIRNGWPVEVPSYDVRGQGSITGQGSVLLDRPAPQDIVTGATGRWIARDYSTSTYTWSALTGYEITGNWTSNATYAPGKQPNYAYRYRKGMLVRPAVRFSGENEDHMWSSWSGQATGLSDYTIIMVAQLGISNNMTSDEDDDNEEAGLFSPVTGGTGDPTLKLMDDAMWVRTGPSKGFVKVRGMNDFLRSTRPMYLAYVVGYPRIRIYTGYGPGSLKRFRLSYPHTGVVQNLDLYLGRTTPDASKSATMKVFDINFYDSRLAPERITREVSKLAKSYGGR